MRCRSNLCPIVSLRPSIHYLQFTRMICHLIKVLIININTSGLGHHPGKKKICHQNNFYQMSTITETSAAARHKIEVEQKCVERKKYSRMHPLQTRITTRKEGPKSFLRREIIGEWKICSTRSNTSNPRHTIRH